MLGDPWPEEPDDPYGDPGAAGSSGDPEVPAGAELSDELFRAFWGLVVMFNVGVFATALGALLLAFRGDVALGGGLLVVGLVALAYGVHRYRRYRATGFAPVDDGGGDGPAS